MKRLLYGATALVATGMLSGGAGAADKIELGVGGYIQAFGVFSDQDDGAGEPGANLRDHHLAREGEIYFRGTTNLHNGLEVGVVVQLETETCADQIDQSYVWFEGGFGQVRLGNHYGASYEMFYGAPTPILGHGVNTPNLIHLATGGNSIVSPVSYTTVSYDTEKFTYFTPRIAASNSASRTCRIPARRTIRAAPAPRWASPAAARAAAPRPTIRSASNRRSSSSASTGSAASWAPTSAPTAPMAGATWNRIRRTSSRIGTSGASASTPRPRASPSGRHTAATIRAARAASTATTTTSALTYACAGGRWTAGVAYAHVESEVGGGGGEDELDVVELGARYALGPGVVLSGGLQYWDLQSAAGLAANENEALFLVFGTGVSF